MWELREHRVTDDFDALSTEDFRVQRDEDAGMRLVQLWRTKFARWEEDTDEPDQVGTIGVAWELVEKPCECGSDPADTDDECVCDSLADALKDVLKDWEVWPTSEWEASEWPVPWDDKAQMARVWVSAHENYHEPHIRYDYSLHIEGVSLAVRRELFAAVGVSA